jgi:hypothetical protein
MEPQVRGVGAILTEVPGKGTRRRTYFVLMLAARYWAQIVAALKN